MGRLRAAEAAAAEAAAAGAAPPDLVPGTASAVDSMHRRISSLAMPALRRLERV